MADPKCFKFRYLVGNFIEEWKNALLEHLKYHAFPFLFLFYKLFIHFH